MTNERQQAFDIRRFQPGDGERVREVHDRAMRGTPEYLPDLPDEDLEAIEDHYLDAAGEFLVGHDGETIVAMGAYTTPDEWKDAYLDIDGTTAELTRMRVDPDWQGRGYGTAMYRTLVERARDDGYRRFVLDTGAENDRARGFYERLGFECQSRISVGSEEETLEMVLYQQSIER
ncbi:GNAT family N-acetyltransferase [Haloarcula salinisoli]|uniref:GNAT family N-acetyltransferase n=1 Tax=Haloarcula salinisoli TaxID=2487746 RepID=A0A8J8C780_9EURY|nr:GNAT family N-acetyltransferase [Halomicroarcula salinisoli]MBX0285505.1 GNAT family N-acetyltransferase [Halomicroarcula salinisoli]MBX0303012.1 GNAT family N-acetyltransferase [Halomicroarcula salinisoli]